MITAWRMHIRKTRTLSSVNTYPPSPSANGTYLSMVLDKATKAMVAVQPVSWCSYSAILLHHLHRRHKSGAVYTCVVGSRQSTLSVERS